MTWDRYLVETYYYLCKSGWLHRPAERLRDPLFWRVVMVATNVVKQTLWTQTMTATITAETRYSVQLAAIDKDLPLYLQIYLIFEEVIRDPPL